MKIVALLGDILRDSLYTDRGSRNTSSFHGDIRV